MKKKAGLTLILAILCFLMSAFPAMAGEWHKTAEDQYQYIKDDGTKATGLLELKDGTYYLDDKGNRKTSYWLRYKGDWYFFGEDGQMVTDSWVDNYHVVKTDRWIRCVKSRQKTKTADTPAGVHPLFLFSLFISEYQRSCRYLPEYRSRTSAHP